MTQSPLVEALSRVADANDGLRRQLAEDKSIVLQAMATLDSGESVRSILDFLPVHFCAVASETAIENLLTARRQLRGAVAAAATAEGMAAEEIAAIFDVRPGLIEKDVGHQADG